MEGMAVGRYMLVEVMEKILKLKSKTMHSIDPVRHARRCEITWLLFLTLTKLFGSGLVTYFEIFSFAYAFGLN